MFILMVILLNFFERVQSSTLTVQENSWPQQSSVVVRDQAGKYELAVLTELSHALVLESPQNSGKFQIMISRRFSIAGDVTYDDKLDQSQRMWIVLGASSTATRVRRNLLPRKQFPLRFSASLATPTPSQWTTKYRTSLAPLAADLPVNIHLFSLTPLQNETDGSTSIILRLQHLYELGEDQTLSQPVTINLSQIFSVSPYVISSLVERTLVYSIDKSALQRWNWPTATSVPEKWTSSVDSDDFIVTLNALEIRTYQITFKG